MPDAEATQSSPTFTFQGFVVRRTLFEEIDGAKPELSRPPQLNLGMKVSAGILLNPGTLVSEVRLDFSIAPDVRYQPYKIEVGILGTFGAVDGNLEQLKDFCKLNAPVILFPYVRQIVHRLTMDARYGLVRMNPMNIGALMSSGWHEATVNPTEPSPPSEQSPSAEKG